MAHSPQPHASPISSARGQAGRPILHEAVWRDNLPGLRLLLCTEDIELDVLDEVGWGWSGGSGRGYGPAGGWGLRGGRGVETSTNHTRE